MPAFITHYLFSEEMLDIIANDVDFELNRSAVAIGTQGPDIFFFHRFLPIFMAGKSRRKVGGALHKSQPAKLFEAMAEYIPTSSYPNIARSYAYGFVMHYALDKSCHPFVYAFENSVMIKGKPTHHSTGHNTIEHGMDTYILNMKKGIADPSDFDSAGTFGNDDIVFHEIARMISFVVPRVIGEPLSEQEAFYAIKDTIFMQKFLLNRDNKIMKRVGILDDAVAPVLKNYRFSAHINPKDLENVAQYANIEKRLWHSPYDESVDRFDSYIELFDKAKDDCALLIKGFDNVCNGSANGYDMTKNISFLTGLEVK